MGGAPGRILIVGCEPAEIGSDDDGQLGLSAPVEAAVDEAIALIETLVSKTLNGQESNETPKAEMIICASPYLEKSSIC